MRGLFSRARRPGLSAGLVALIVLAFGVMPAGAGSNILSGPPGTVITVTVSDCANGVPAAALINGVNIVDSRVNTIGSGVVQLTVSGSVGTTLTIKSVCLTYGGNNFQPDESFLITDGTAASFATPGGTVGVATSAGTLSALSSGPPAAGAPAGVSFPFGMLGFTVSGITTGSTVTVTLTVPEPMTDYWKFQNGTWSKFAGAAFTANTVTLTLVDGGAGDADGAANGKIVDPGAPGVSVAAVPISATPTFTG